MIQFKFFRENDNYRINKFLDDLDMKYNLPNEVLSKYANKVVDKRYYTEMKISATQEQLEDQFRIVF